MFVVNSVSGLINDGSTAPDHPVKVVEVAAARKRSPRIQSVIKTA
jgi:hypothetical protein